MSRFRRGLLNFSFFGKFRIKRLGAGGYTPPASHGDSLLMESGDYLLLESGDTILKE